MAWKSRKRTGTRGVRKSPKARKSGWAAKPPLRAKKRSGVQRRKSSGSAGRNVQTLRIELAPGLNIGGGSAGGAMFSRPMPSRRFAKF